MKQIQKNISKPEPSEHEEAVGFVNWFYHRFPGVLIFHIPNGMKRDIRTAKALKDEGVKPGMPDYFIPEWLLWVELKRQTKGSLSLVQKQIHNHLTSIGQTVIVGRGAKDTSRQILEFIENHPRHFSVSA